MSSRRAALGQSDLVPISQRLGYVRAGMLLGFHTLLEVETRLFTVHRVRCLMSLWSFYPALRNAESAAFP